MLKNKKLLVLVLCVIMLGQSTLGMAVSFTDVNKTNISGWAYDYIMELANKGIINGYPDGTYKPENFVSVTETLKLLVGIANPSKAQLTAALNKNKALVEKVKTPDWAQEIVAYALEAGILKSGELEEFYASNMLMDNTKVFIPRYNVAILTARTLGLKDKNTQLIYTDLKDIPTAGYGQLAALIETGVLNKEGRDGAFLPKANIKRSEMAKMMKFAYDYAKKNENLPVQTETGVVFDYYSTTRDMLVYTANKKNVSAVITDNTSITDKNGNVVKLADLSKFKGADVVVSYRLIDDERVATTIKFASDGMAQSGEYTLVSSRYSNNKYYVTLKELGKELQIKSNVVKNGNSTILLEDIAKDTKLVLKIENDVVTEASLKTAQEGQYMVEAITNTQISLSPIKGGLVKTYSIYSDTPVYKGSTKVDLGSIRVGDTVDVSFRYTDVIDRIVLFPSTNVLTNTYTFLENIDDRIYVKKYNASTDLGEGFAVTSNTKFVDSRGNTIFRNSLIKGEQVILTFDSRDNLTQVQLSNYNNYREGTAYSFKEDYTGAFQFSNSKDWIRVYTDTTAKVYINGVESRLTGLPNSGTAYLVFDSNNNLTRINFFTR